MQPKDKIQWDLDVVNSGSASMKNYAITDTMPDPYEFEGDVSYNIKDAKGKNWLSGKLFTIGERKETDTSVTVTLYDGSTREVPLDGSAAEIPIQMADCYGNKKKYNVKVIMKTDAEGKAVLTVEFPHDDLGIPEHGSAVLGVTTANPGNVLNNKVYYNRAYITPLGQTFDQENVSHGNFTKYPYDGAEKDSVENSSLVTVAYGFVSHASKSITEAEENGTIIEANTANSKDTPNYITVQDPKNHLLLYTHKVENTTKKAMTKLVVIDNLPEIGDTGVFEGSSERGSEFKVIMADDPGVKVAVWNQEHTSKTELTETQYQVSYTAKSGKYTREDWTCDAATTMTWTNSVESDTRALRIAIFDESGTLIPQDAIVEITFYARVDMSQFHDSFTLEAAAGLKAYNSFGYHYRRKEDNFDLEAAPDKVGVQIPCIPKLQKLTVDRTGNQEPVETDHTFTFLVHEGEALSDYKTEATVNSSLVSRHSKAGIVTLTVPAGKSISEALSLTGSRLKPVIYDTTQRVWKEVEGQSWNWEKGKVYTIAEIRLPHDYTGAEAVTFTYTPEKNVTYKCQNIRRYGSVNLVKYGINGTSPLSGVTFTIEGNGIEAMSQTTASDGTLQFKNLPEGTYTIRETGTRRGYTLLAEPLTVTIPLAMTEEEIRAKEQETGTTVDRTKGVYDAADGKYYFYEFGFSITNSANLNLPATGGGMDNRLYMGLVAGLLLLGGMLILQLRRRKNYRTGK